MSAPTKPHPLVLLPPALFGSLVLGIMAWFWWADTAPQRTPEARAVQLDHRYRSDLAARVASGEMTFEQAGCEYRGGGWDFEGHCTGLEPPVTRIRVPNEAPARGHLEGGNPRRPPQ